MSRKLLKGVFPLMPLVLKKNQELDLEGLRENVEAYEEAGFHGYIAFGCMGEFYAVNDEEFEKVVDVAVDATQKITSVFGVTSNTTRGCLKRIKYAEDAGADGVMVGPPFLIPCTEEAVFEHYRLIDEAADEIQVMVYNNPFSFRFNMTPEFWDKLMTLESIKAVKESNGDVHHRTLVVSHIAEKINVFPGGEPWLLGDSLLGANSIVSTCGPGAPKAALTFYDACMKRDLSKAIPLHIKFSELTSDITAYNEVAWFKACAELGGFNAGPPRSPYTPLDEITIRKLSEKLKEINILIQKL